MIMTTIQTSLLLLCLIGVHNLAAREVLFVEFFISCAVSNEQKASRSTH